MQFLMRAAIAAVGLWLASLWVGGITISDYGTLALAALLLGVCNAVVKPILVILTLPITVLTLGLFLLVVNAAVLALVALVLPGFAISGFWAAAARGADHQRDESCCVNGDQIEASGAFIVSLAGQLISNTPSRMIAAPANCSAVMRSSRNTKPTTEAIAGFT